MSGAGLRPVVGVGFAPRRAGVSQTRPAEKKRIREQVCAMQAQASMSGSSREIRSRRRAQEAE